MILVDLYCTDCGHNDIDHLINTSDTKLPPCPMCGSIMRRMYSGIKIKTKSRTERKYPTHLMGGGDRARFSKD